MQAHGPQPTTVPSLTCHIFLGGKLETHNQCRCENEWESMLYFLLGYYSHNVIFNGGQSLRNLLFGWSFHGYVNHLWRYNPSYSPTPTDSIFFLSQLIKGYIRSIITTIGGKIILAEDSRTWMIWSLIRWSLKYSSLSSHRDPILLQSSIPWTIVVAPRAPFVNTGNLWSGLVGRKHTKF